MMIPILLWIQTLSLRVMETMNQKSLLRITAIITITRITQQKNMLKRAIRKASMQKNLYMRSLSMMRLLRLKMKFQQILLRECLTRQHLSLILVTDLPALILSHRGFLPEMKLMKRSQYSRNLFMKSQPFMKEKLRILLMT